MQDQEQRLEEQQTRNFNPNEHLVQLKSKQGSQDYLPVQWRLVWFRSECPHGTIDTEEVEVDLDRVVESEAFVWNAEKRRSEKVIKQAKGYARFRCVVTDGKGGRATGTGSEAAADFNDFIEKEECVPLDSEILTRTGFKHYDELTIGEEVLAYDCTTDTATWTPLLNVTTYDIAPLSCLHGKNFTVYCTPDHSWPVYYSTLVNEKRYEYRKLIKANDLKKSHALVLSAPAPSGDHPLSSRDAAIIGWIMTDGTINRRGNSFRCGIYQSKPATVQIIRDLVGSSARETIGTATEMLAKTGTGKVYQCLPQHAFWFSAEESRRLFAAAGVTGPQDLVGMVSQYSHEARQAMLEAMMLADGDKRGNFGKKRKDGVMEAWQVLATLEGYALGMMRISSAGEVPLQRLKKSRHVYASELTLDDAGVAPVWCPTTQYGTWVMRQNGRVMITGNTKSIGRALAALGYGTQFAPELAENHRIVDAPVDTNHPNNERTANNSAPTTSNLNGNEDETNATAQQLDSLRKLHKFLNRDEPDDLASISFLNARKLIQKLKDEYNAQRANKAS